MLVKLILVIGSVLVMADQDTTGRGRPAASRDVTVAEQESPPRDFEFSMIKPVGDYGLEVAVIDFGDYSLRYYLTPDWTAGIDWDTVDGRPVPVKLDITLAVRIDHVTGQIDRWDYKTGTIEPDGAAASGSGGCFQNNCGGGCCILEVAAALQPEALQRQTVTVSSGGIPPTATARACVICVCCNGSSGCQVTLDTCNKA